MDIADFENLEKFRSQVEKDIGPIDILINNAAIIPMLSLQESTNKDILRIVDVNITANYIVKIFLILEALTFYLVIHSVTGIIFFLSAKSIR